MRKLPAVLIICMILSAGCAPLAAPPALMTTGGDFGIVSQKPCGPPCFQGITPGVTTILDAQLKLLRAGAPCTTSPYGATCSSGATYISVGSSGSQHETDQAKVLVGSISLVPPVKVTVGQFIARYGPPDSVWQLMSVSSSQSDMWFFYDELHTRIELPSNQATFYAVAPNTMIEGVTYYTAADYQISAARGAPGSTASMTPRMPWKGYGTYTLSGTVLLSAPPPLLTTGDLGIVSQEPCGPPCFQGITLGVTTIQDAQSKLLKAGVPCSVYTSRFEPQAPIDEESISCSSGAARISIRASIDLAPLPETDPAKVVVDSITLSPPTKVTLGEFITQHGTPDGVLPWYLEGSFQLLYERLQTIVVVISLPGENGVLGPESLIHEVTYSPIAEYEKGRFTAPYENFVQPWTGYSTYERLIPTPPPSPTPKPTLPPGIPVWTPTP